MTGRSRAREVALQLLYLHDLNPRVERKAIERFVQERLRDDTLAAFALGLYDGVRAQHQAIDQSLAGAAENWRLPRMAAVDRNVLRLGAYELLHTPDTPPGVALNEAIELARRFGSLDSPAFVNGVLDKIKRSAEAPAAQSDGAAERQAGQPDPQEAAD
jgi:N utilization substance protein B